jgi:hypothetical protein
MTAMPFQQQLALQGRPAGRYTTTCNRVSCFIDCLTTVGQISWHRWPFLMVCMPHQQAIAFSVWTTGPSQPFFQNH